MNDLLVWVSFENREHAWSIRNDETKPKLVSFFFFRYEFHLFYRKLSKIQENQLFLIVQGVFVIFRLFFMQICHHGFQVLISKYSQGWDLERPNLKWPKEKRPKMRFFSIWLNIQMAESK